MFGAQKEASALCLLYEIYHREGHLLHGYLHHFVAACNAIVSVAQGELALVIVGTGAVNSVGCFCCASVELSGVGCLWWWYLQLFCEHSIHLCLHRA